MQITKVAKTGHTNSSANFKISPIHVVILCKTFWRCGFMFRQFAHPKVQLKLGLEKLWSGFCFDLQKQRFNLVEGAVANQFVVQSTGSNVCACELDN